MDSCVQQVMRRDGVDKQRAIAICHASVVKEEQVASSRQRRIQRRAAARKAAEDAGLPNSDPAVLAALALTDDSEALASYIAGQEPPAGEPSDGPTEEEEPGTPDLADTEPLEEAAPSPEGDEEPETEPESKDVGEKYSEAAEVAGVWMPFEGATTWGDYDAYLKAREQMQHVNDLTYVFESLVGNVMRDPGIELTEKATAIASLATGYKTRLSSATKGLSGLVYQFKRTLSGGSRNDLPDSAFAYIEPGGKKDESGRTVPRSNRHYPINDKAHIRNALSRAAAAISAGGKTADIARRALPKIRAAAKREGIGAPAAKPKKGLENGFQVLKSTDGSYRWFGWVSNKWRDRDAAHAPRHGGEIITSDAHKEFVGWVYEDPAARMPALWLWHTPGTARKQKADWLDFADGFLVASGPLTEDEAGELMALELIYDLGMSHGLFADEVDKERGYITKYRTFESTVLPQQFAANLWTAFSTILKEVSEMGFTDDKRKFLVSALGETRVAELEGTTADMAKNLLELGIEHKEVKPATETAPVTEPAAKVETPAPAAVKTLDDLVAGVAEQDIKTINPQGLSEMLGKMDQRLTTLEKGQAKAIAEAIMPKAGPFAWDRPTTSEANVTKESEPQPESKAPEGDGWLAEAFGSVAQAVAQ